MRRNLQENYSRGKRTVGWHSERENKLVRSRLKCAGHVERMGDEKLTTRDQVARKWRECEGRKERSGKSERRMENTSKRQTELEIVYRERSETKGEERKDE